MNYTLNDLQALVNNLKTNVNTFNNSINNNTEEYTDKKKAIIDEFVIDTSSEYGHPKNWSNSDFAMNSVCYILSD